MCLKVQLFRRRRSCSRLRGDVASVDSRPGDVTAGKRAMQALGRRKFLYWSVGMLSVAPRRVWAESYPSRPVRLIAPFPPGGVVDLFSRLIGQALSERLGQSIFVENRAGAGGNLGTSVAAHAAPDGYTLL